VATLSNTLLFGPSTRRPTSLDPDQRDRVHLEAAEPDVAPSARYTGGVQRAVTGVPKGTTLTYPAPLRPASRGAQKF